jgi:hypothetical protein
VLPHFWVYLGITGNLGASDKSYVDSTSYGWAGPNQVWTGGSNRSENSGWIGFTEGECLYFHLKSNKLTMFSIHKNQKFVIGTATTAIREYYIHFNFYAVGTKISLELLGEDERKRLIEN